jgi:preprotein translocase subunit YajC
MTWNGIDLSGLLGTLASIVTALLGWALVSIRKHQEAQATASKAQIALLKLGEIVTTVAGKAWAELSPKVQAALANDGKIDAAERAEIEVVVAGLVKDLTDAASLTEIAKALGLPLPGLIARIAAGIIDIVTKAHDPDIKNSASPAAFPVQDFNGPEYQPG